MGVLQNIKRIVNEEIEKETYMDIFNNYIVGKWLLDGDYLLKFNDNTCFNYFSKDIFNKKNIINVNDCPLDQISIEEEVKNYSIGKYIEINSSDVDKLFRLKETFQKNIDSILNSIVVKEPYENMKDGVVLSWHGSGKVKIWSFSEKTYSVFNYESIFYDLKTLETSTDKFNEYKDRFWNKVYTYENVSIINEITKMKIQKIFNTTQIGLNTIFENIKNKYTKQQ